MLKVGIVGLPNVGKSTLFSALTKKQVACENFPFCTIDPNVGVVAVPDERLQKLATIEKSKKIVPTAIEFVDIAGLVAGAHKGEGLGNKFLAAIREVDAICHVVRAFEDATVHHVDGSVNPDRDRETILTELILADVATVTRAVETARGAAKTGVPDALKKKDLLERLLAHLNETKPAISFSRSEDEAPVVRDLHLLTDKPIIEVINTASVILSSAEPGQAPPDFGLRPQNDTAPQDDNALALDIKLEADIAQLPEEEQGDYLRELGMSEPALNRLINTAYARLGLITFFTAGEMEARAWTVADGSTAPTAAGKIHSDFEEKFIKAEIVSYGDFISCEGWKGVKETGKMHLEGKTYVMREGDVVFFHHG